MNIRSKNIALLFSCVLLSISCVDKYLPDSLDAFDRDVNFTTKLYRPQLGKNTLMSDNASSYFRNITNREGRRKSCT